MAIFWGATNAYDNYRGIKNGNITCSILDGSSSQNTGESTSSEYGVYTMPNVSPDRKSPMLDGWITLFYWSQITHIFFPACQVRVVRFYVSCLLLSSSPLLLLLLNRDPRRTVFSVGPQPRPSTPSVPCRTSTTTIHAQCSLPDLNHDHPRLVFPAGPHVGRYGTKNVFTNMFDRRCADMFGHVCLFGSGGPLACLVMFKQTCWELWSLLHMAHWHVYILFDRLTCTMTCQVKQMIGIVSWAKVPWQKLQTKVVSTSCFEMSWWGSLEAK